MHFPVGLQNESRVLWVGKQVSNYSNLVTIKSAVIFN